MTARRDPAAPRGDGVWVVAVAAFTVVALALTGVAIWSTWPASGGSPSAGNVLFWSAAYFLLAVPAGLPATLLGAWLARHLLARHPDGLTLSAWLLRGTTAGALLGEFGCIPWFVLLAAGDPPANVLSRVFLVGGTSGLIVGAAVALWCWRVSPSA